MAQWQRVGFQTQRLGVRIPLAQGSAEFFKTERRRNGTERGTKFDGTERKITERGTFRSVEPCSVPFRCCRRNGNFQNPRSAFRSVFVDGTATSNFPVPRSVPFRSVPYSITSRRNDVMSFRVPFRSVPWNVISRRNEATAFHVPFRSVPFRSTNPTKQRWNTQI